MLHTTHHTHAAHFVIAAFRVATIAMFHAVHHTRTTMSMEYLHQLHGINGDTLAGQNIVIGIRPTVQQHCHWPFGNADRHRIIGIGGIADFIMLNSRQRVRQVRAVADLASHFNTENRIIATYRQSHAMHAAHAAALFTMTTAAHHALGHFWQHTGKRTAT